MNGLATHHAVLYPAYGKCSQCFLSLVFGISVSEQSPSHLGGHFVDLFCAKKNYGFEEEGR